MNPKPYSINSFVFRASDRLILDANIWLIIYGPQDPQDRRVSIYSGALKRMLTASCGLYIDVLILSEFVNRYARIEYSLEISRGFKGNFKAFRGSSGYKPVAKAIAAASRSILSHSIQIGSGFETINVIKLLSDFEIKCRDFNDQIISELCLTKKLVLITDDQDFKGLPIPIITANKKLLQP